MAGFYAVYHGPEGLRRIAGRIHAATAALASALREAGYLLKNETFFDTLTVLVPSEKRAEILARAAAAGINLREDQPDALGVSLDEAAIETGEWRTLFEVFAVEEKEGSPDEPT